MNVIKRFTGWFVEDAQGYALAGPFETNARAWKAVDRLQNEPVNPAEKRADWVAGKILNSGSRDATTTPVNGDGEAA